MRPETRTVFSIEMKNHPAWICKDQGGRLYWGSWNEETLRFESRKEAEAFRQTIGNASLAQSFVSEHEEVPPPQPPP